MVILAQLMPREQGEIVMNSEFWGSIKVGHEDREGDTKGTKKGA
jgi:hypothetical protein